MDMRKNFVAIFLVAGLITGCSSLLTASIEATPIPISNFLLNKDPNNPATPTPFQPIPPTATIGAISTPLPSLVPTEQNVPQVSSSVNLSFPRPPGQVNILLLGSDYRPGRGYRTDVMMVLSLNPTEGTASLTSFPRDLYVDIPGIGPERINTAQSFGGFALSAATLMNNFNVPVDYYLMTTFSGFKGIVDTLGGVNIYASYELYDSCSLPQAVNKMCYVPAGSNTMNGETALWYVRSRYSTNDFDRTRRAQEMVRAIFQKTMSLDALSRGPELYNMFISSVETNIPLEVVRELLPFSSKIIADPSIVKRYAIGPENTYDYIVPGSGAMVLIPDMVSISGIIQQAIYP
ncbi:MAG: LCP family protein [Chloroflexi bacterium]|nr:LCP family protein [Chloroflexota bacterium]